MASASRLYRRRRWNNFLALALSCAALLFGLFFLIAILWTLVDFGLPALKSDTFTKMTPPPGAAGGLLNAIVGSALMTAIATLIGTPVGILAGTYLSEFADGTKMASVIRFVNGIMMSAPSVVIGFFAYAVIVVNTGHFSGWAGALALAFIIIPVVVSSTENMLRLVPVNLREAAAALGAPQWKITMMVTYRAARAGIMTGVLLGVARISGESAPLLFTALNNQFWSADLSKAMPNLPVTIFQFAMSPYESWKQLAWAGALIITTAVLVLNIVARIFLRKKSVAA